MHIPVLLAGFLCGPWWAAAVGAAAPLLRFALFGMPPLFPTGLAMCFELAAYGLASGLLSRTLPRTAAGTYGSLVGAMLLGRVVWGAAQTILLGLSGSAFTWRHFSPVHFHCCSRNHCAVGIDSAGGACHAPGRFHPELI